MLRNDISLRDSILLHVKGVPLKYIKRWFNDHFMNDVSSPIYYQNALRRMYINIVYSIGSFVGFSQRQAGPSLITVKTILYFVNIFVINGNWHLLNSSNFVRVLNIITYFYYYFKMHFKMHFYNIFSFLEFQLFWFLLCMAPLTSYHKDLC